MKKTIYIIALFFVFNLNAQEFYGGNADGSTSATIIENQSIYVGGNADGFSSIIISDTNNNYIGGISDGFSSLQLNDDSSFYVGGNSDGFSNAYYNELLSTYLGGNADGFSSMFFDDNNNMYAGGFSDGFSNSIYNESLSAFFGGNADGFAMTTIYDLLINPIAFIQGAYINPVSGEETLMRDNLRVASLIPTTSPYVDALTCNTSVFTSTGANAIVDWVWVELRDENDNTNILSSQSALLQRDGDIVDADGTSDLSFNLSDGNYFVVVTHRNHLGVISANAITLSSVVTTVNLSSSSASVSGGSNGLVDIGNGIYALYAGDYDGNGQVQNTDLTALRPLLGQPSNYDDADLDMNTQVQNTDVNNLLNPNKGRGKQYAKQLQLKLYAKRKE